MCVLSLRDNWIETFRGTTSRFKRNKVRPAGVDNGQLAGWGHQPTEVERLVMCEVMIGD